MERLSIVDTPSPGDIIAVFKNEDGQLRNVTIKDEALQQQLRETPTHIVNPERAPLELAVFEAAEAHVAKEEKGNG